MLKGHNIFSLKARRGKDTNTIRVLKLNEENCV